MIRYVDECVGCPPEMGCLGAGCPKRNVERHFCDFCEKREADYDLDGDELCENCAEKRLNEAWNGLSLEDKAEALGYELGKIEY